MSDRPLEPWDRRANESDEAWAAFAAYRDQALPRSLRRLGEEMSYADHTLVGRWSSQHDWQDRCAAWDLEQDRLQREEFQAENVATARRHARQMQQRLSVGDLLTAEVVRRIRENPEVLKGLKMGDLMDLFVKDARTAPRLLVAERLARGMTTENVEHTGVDAYLEKAKQMTADQMEAFLAGAAAGAAAAEEQIHAEQEAVPGG